MTVLTSVKLSVSISTCAPKSLQSSFILPSYNVIVSPLCDVVTSFEISSSQKTPSSYTFKYLPLSHNIKSVIDNYNRIIHLRQQDILYILAGSCFGKTY